MARRVGWAMVLVWLAACSSERARDVSATDASGAERAAPTALTPEWHAAIAYTPSVQRALISMRAGGQSLALLALRSPSTMQIFRLQDRGRMGSREELVPYAPDPRPQIVAPVMIAQMTDSAKAWLLDSTLNALVSTDIGGGRTIILRFDSAARASAACADSLGRINVLDAAKPGRVLRFSLDTSVKQTELSVAPRRDATKTATDDSSSTWWRRATLNASEGGVCALHIARTNDVYVLGNTAALRLPLVRAGRSGGASDESSSWFARLTGAGRRAAHVDSVVEVSSWPGGVATLVGSQSSYAGTIVDFYHANGAYRESVRLGNLVLKIAFTGDRLIAATAHGDTTFLASYVLPASLRTGTR